MNLENTSSISRPAIPYEQATGSPKYGLTNDYMFRVVFQENELARKGLISAVLHMNPDNIQSVTISNPITPGSKLEDKEFVLDLKVLLNNNHLINLEMQMADQHNWQDRSLSYLCRSFDQLYKGEDYAEAKPATHIGFLNFAPFPERLEFNGCYKILNIKNHALYSDKLTLYVIDLTHIELATEEDKTWGIDHWARLFIATTWEEVKMIAERDIHMQAAAEEMYVLSADEMIEERCRARDDYMKQERTRNKIMKELTETNTSLLNEKASLLNEKEALLNEIESLHKRIAELESQN
ncbi:MAG: Rpn family recombination-promoting nuclease/putative transposase [Agathobacter sp.]|nr:Rpn family recombination-promoting nuclease/putative transposase [Agathobacter sp.]